MDSDQEQADEALRRKCAEVASTSTCLNLKMAARAASHILDEFLQPLGLRASQFSVLNQISLRGSSTMTGLADALVTDRTTLTRNLKPLERDGLVEIVAGKDRRVREITLTGKGRALLEQALPLREQAEECLVNGLGEERWRSLLSNLAALTRITRQP